MPGSFVAGAAGVLAPPDSVAKTAIRAEPTGTPSLELKVLTSVISFNGNRSRDSTRATLQPVEDRALTAESLSPDRG